MLRQNEAALTILVEQQWSLDPGGPQYSAIDAVSHYGSWARSMLDEVQYIPVGRPKLQCESLG